MGSLAVLRDFEDRQVRREIDSARFKHFLQVYENDWRAPWFYVLKSDGRDLQIIIAMS